MQLHLRLTRDYTYPLSHSFSQPLNVYSVALTCKVLYMICREHEDKDWPTCFCLCPPWEQCLSCVCVCVCVQKCVYVWAHTRACVLCGNLRIMGRGKQTTKRIETGWSVLVWFRNEEVYSARMLAIYFSFQKSVYSNKSKTQSELKKNSKLS